MIRKFSIVLIVILLPIAIAAADPTDLIIHGERCGKHGSARPGTKEYDQNVFKNRFDIPPADRFDRSISLEDIAIAKENQTGFSQNKAVEIEGYVFAVKVGGKETCNCKATDPLFRDTHIELVASLDETSKEHRVIVEVTPRLRQIMEEAGIDWTTENLKRILKGKYVRVQGWLFYDVSHRTEDFANDPDDNIGRANWRATSWEVHPITSLEIIDNEMPEEEMLASERDDFDFTAAPPPVTRRGPTDTTNTRNENLKAMQTPTAQDILILILLGAILGMVGQGIRVIVGLKKLNNTAAELNIPSDDLFKMRQLVMSFFIAFAIGAIAGVLAAVTNINVKIDQSVIIAFITAGYAGTDFVEGFIKKEGNVIVSKNPPPAVS